MELHELEAQLDEFIGKVKNSKSFKSSPKMRESFSPVWIEYAEKTSFSEKAMNYFYDGFKIAWSDPLFEYLKKTTVSPETLKKFFCLRLDSYHPHYAMCLHLLSHLINSKIENPSYYEKLFTFMTRNFKNKEGYVNGNAVKDFEKYFIFRINKDFVLPDLKKMDLNNMQLNKLGIMFTYCIENLSEETKNTLNPDVLNKVLNWSKEIVIDVEEAMKIQTPAPKPKTTEEKLEEALIQLKKQKETIKALNDTVAHQQERIIVEGDERAKLLNELRKAQSQNSVLSYDKHQLQNTITELEQQIKSLHEDVASEKKLSRNVAGNSQKQLDAFFFKLSENLKFEYEDFKDALDADMSVSLGENMRTQLGNVFKILEDSGIKLE